MSDGAIYGQKEYISDLALTNRVLARRSEIAFIRQVAPWFVVEEIHCLIATHHEAMLVGEIDRLMVFMPPRTGKSQMGSVFLPAMWSGNFPGDQILQVGHSVELSRGFSLDVRNIMRGDAYREIFPGVALAKDAQATGKWRIEDTMSVAEEIERNGVYNAAGVTSSIAGKGFNFGCCDDAMSEQDKDSKITKDRIGNWWGPGFYTRRMPERNAILINATRWGTDDLPGRILEQQKKLRDAENEKVHGADNWVVLNIPAILDRDSAKRIYTVAKEYGVITDLIQAKEGDSFAPRRWTQKELARSRANMTERDWNALYLGRPSVDEGHILKRKHWRLWPREKLPECHFIFQMYDTAMDAKEANDKSARSTWGIFEHKEREGERPSHHMILLSAWDERVEAPDLKRHILIAAWGGKAARAALEEMNPHDKARYADIDPDQKGEEPDAIIIENKSSGQWLIKELRRIRKPKPLPVRPFDLPRGTSGELGKFARAQLASLVLEQGAVWYPPRKWAERVIDVCAQAQFLGNDKDADLADTVTAAMIYVRKTYRVELGSDIDEEEERRAGLKEGQRRQMYGAR